MSVKKRAVIIAIILVAAFFIWKVDIVNSLKNSSGTAESAETTTPTDRVEKIEITPESTFSILMQEAGISVATSTAIFAATQEVYDLSSIRVGRTLDLIYDATSDEFKQLVYQINTEEELYVTNTGGNWTAERKPIDYDVEVVTDSGTIDSSMYQAALDSGIDERAIIELANAFQWSVDFALDVRTGDTFEFIYEKRFRNGRYIMPGQILAGKYVNAGTAYYAFYFEESESNKGYFDENGNSVQKLFLKAPVSFKYISSGFTTGQRYVQAFNVSTGHRAIDYAAAVGTPIRAVGDGTVTFSGWNGPYGNFISIRHNGTYSTNYAHLSRRAVAAGQKVSQGQTIGYVGSTGFSTGPHLHYEMVKNGIKINPLTEVLPPGQAIADENKERFFAAIVEHKKQLD